MKPEFKNKQSASVCRFGLLLRLLTGLALTTLLFASAQAATISTTGVTYDMSLGSTWAGGVVPGTNDIANFFNAGIYTNPASSVLRFGGITINASGVDINPSASGPSYTIYLGTNGIGGNYSPDRFGPNVTYNVSTNNQTWSIAIGNFQAVVSGSNTINLNGANYWFRGNNGNFSGVWNLAANGLFQADTSSSMGGSSARLNMANGSTLRLDASQSESAAVSLTGATATFRTSKSTTVTMSGPISGGSLAAPATLMLLGDNGGAETLNLNGSLSNHVGSVVVQRQNSSSYTVNLGSSSTFSCAPGSNHIVDGVDTTAQALIRADTGTGPSYLNLNGAFFIDTNNVALADGNSWWLVDTTNLVVTYGGTFSVTGYTLGSPGVWTKTDQNRVWTFNQTNGILSLAITPPPVVTNITTTGSSFDMSQPAAWDGGVVPQNSWQGLYVPVFDVAGTYFAPSNSTFNWLGISFNAPSVLIDPTNPVTINLGASGLTGTNNIARLGSNGKLIVNVGANNQTWSVGSDDTGAEIRGTATITLTSTNRTRLRTANPSFTGIWQLNGGYLYPEINAAVGADGVQVQLMNNCIFCLSNSLYSSPFIQLAGNGRLRTLGNAVSNAAVSTLAPGAFAGSGGITGTGNLTLDSSLAYGAIQLNGQLDFTGNILVGAPANGMYVVLGSSAKRTFNLGANGVGDQIAGSSATLSHLRIDGTIGFRLTNAVVATGNAWTIIDPSNLAVTYGAGFAVDGFSLQSGLWKRTQDHATWTFNPTNGVLSVVVNGNYFVNPVTGSDTNSGSELTPFKTITKAEQMASAGSVILLRGGTYRQCLNFTKSGQTGNPITYAGFPNETATISGFLVVSNWSTWSNGIYRAAVSPVPSYHVLINGESGIESRWPNYTNWDYVMSTRAYATGDGNSGAFPTGKDQIIDYNIPDNMPTNWLVGAKCLYQSWYRTWSKGDDVITNFNPMTKTITLNRMMDYSDQGQLVIGGNAFPFELHGSVGLIDMDKEWAYEASSGMLYVQTPGGVDPATLVIESQFTNTTVNFSSVSNVRLENVQIRGGSIQTASTSANCVVNNVHMRFAISPSNLVGTNDEFSDSDFIDSRNGTINIAGTSDRFVNNNVSNIGEQNRLLYLAGSGHLLAYNDIGISFGCALSLSATKRCQIVHNTFTQFSLRNKDMGAIYSVFNGGMTEIACNRFLNSYDAAVHTHGVYLDGQASYYLIHHNLTYDDAVGGKHGLIYANNTDYRWYDTSDGSGATPIANPLQRSTGGTGTTSDTAGCVYFNNLYAYAYNATIGQPGSRYYLSLAATNTAAVFNDTNGLDIGYLTHPKNFDFTLKTGSPAIDAGFAADGITDGYSGVAPDFGAFESGQPVWKSGYDFVNPPVVAYSYNTNPPVVRFGNLLRNGSFDDSTSGTIGPWVTEAGSAATQTENLTWPPGNLIYLTGYSLKTGSGINRYSQLVTNVLGGRQYCFYLAIRSIDPSQTFEMGVRLSSGSTIKTNVSNLSTASNTWNLVYVTFTLPAGTYSATPYFGKTSSDTSAAYFDEAIFSECFPDPYLAPAFPGAVKYAPTVDTYVKASDGTNIVDHSQETSLNLTGSGKYQTTPYMKFNLASLLGRSISSAQLYLYGSADSRFWSVAINDVTSDWTVSGPGALTWSNQPPTGATLAILQFNGAGVYDKTVDMTGYVKGRLATNGLVNLTFDDLDNSSDTFGIVSSNFKFSTSPWLTQTPFLAITFTPAPKPTNLLATATATNITLTWSGSPDALSYQIQRRVGLSGSFAVLGTNTTPIFVDSSIQTGSTYTYIVTGMNESGLGTPSDLLTVSLLPNTPTNLLWNVTGTNLNLSWPSNYIGWILQKQTNSLNTGLFTNWVDVPASVSNSQWSVPIGSMGAGFYRLRSP